MANKDVRMLYRRFILNLFLRQTSEKFQQKTLPTINFCPDHVPPLEDSRINMKLLIKTCMAKKQY